MTKVVFFDGQMENQVKWMLEVILTGIPLGPAGPGGPVSP